MISSKFRVPTFVQNDANACALVEWLYGVGKGSKNMIFLTCGTGLGAGLILNGELYKGACGNAGEIGHIRLEHYGPAACGKAGSLEGFASGKGIAEIAKLRAGETIQRGEKCGYCSDLSEIESITAKSLAIAAESGAEDAREVYAECGDFLGRGLAVLCDILNPELIVIGSVFQRSENLLRPSMERALAREAMPCSVRACRVEASRLGNEIGDYAALSVAAKGLNDAFEKNFESK